MMYFLILTALTVSIDSFICGFSLSLVNKKKLYIVLTIALMVLCMCLITNYAPIFLSDYLTENTTIVGGIILISIGVYNFVKCFTNANEKAITNKREQILLIGFAVGLDGAFANLSLSLMNINEFYVPIIIAFMHALMIWLGIILSQTKLAKKFAKIEFFPPLILIFLGVQKTLGLFI